MLTRLQDDYTPILIEFKDAVTGPSGQVVSTPTATWLEIIPPEQVRKGSIQSLPVPFYLQVPSDGVLRLRLLNSNVFLNPGRYTVNFYRYAVDQTPSFRKHFHTEQWVVPQIPEPVSVLLTHSSQGDKIDLPVWSLVSTPFPIGEYKIIDSHIVWLSNGPAVGESYTVMIQPGYSRGDIIWPRPAGYNPHPRYPISNSYPAGY